MRNILILVSIFICSCNADQIIEPKNKLSVFPDVNQGLILSEIISDFNFVSLESKDEFYIGDVWKLVIEEEYIYALDMLNSASLNKYTIEGNHIYTIDEYGNGLGEFIAPQDFIIDSENNEIIIYDASGIKLLFYDLETAQFKREKILDFRIGRFDRLNNNFVFHLNNQKMSGIEYNIIITDSSFNILNNFLKIDENFIRFHFYLPTNFTNYNDYIYFTQPSDYNIYRFHKDSTNIESYIYVDFGEYKLPKEFFEYHETTTLRYNYAENSAHDLSPYFENDYFIYLKYFFNRDSHISRIESKETGNVVQFNNDKVIDDIGVGPLPLWPLSVFQNQLVYLQQPEELIRYIDTIKEEMDENEWNQFKEENQKLISFYMSSEKNDNPYLIFLKIEF